MGAYYLDKAKQEASLDALKHTRDGFLTRQSDRALFDLPTEKS